MRAPAPPPHIQTTDVTGTSTKLSATFPCNVASPLLGTNSIKFCLETAAWELGFLHCCPRQLNQSVSIEESINSSANQLLKQTLYTRCGVHNCGASRYLKIFLWHLIVKGINHKSVQVFFSVDHKKRLRNVLGCVFQKHHNLDNAWKSPENRKITPKLKLCHYIWAISHDYSAICDMSQCDVSVQFISTAVIQV